MNQHLQRGLQFALLGFTIGTASAQPVAQKPTIVVGDSWDFKATSTSDGTPFTWSRTVIGIGPNGELDVRIDEKRVAKYDEVMNPMPEGLAASTRVLARYPLTVGDEWDMSRKLPNPDAAFVGKAKVVAEESVTVPAGTFLCYRIEASGSYTRKLYGEYRSWTRWYCPEVKWMAKEILATRTYNPFNPASNGFVTETSELVKFTLAK